MSRTLANVFPFTPTAIELSAATNLPQNGAGEIISFPAHGQSESSVRPASHVSPTRYQLQSYNKSELDRINPDPAKALGRSVLVFPKFNVTGVQITPDEGQRQTIGKPANRMTIDRSELNHHWNKINAINLVSDNERAVQHLADSISFYTQIDHPMIRSEILKRHYHLMGSLIPHVKDVFYDIDGYYFDQLSRKQIEIPHLRAFLQLMSISSHQAIKRHIWTTVPQLLLWSNLFIKDDPDYATALQDMLQDEFGYYLKRF